MQNTNLSVVQQLKTCHELANEQSLIKLSYDVIWILANEVHARNYLLYGNIGNMLDIGTVWYKTLVIIQ